MNPPFTVCMIGPPDDAALDRVAEGVFDNDIEPRRVKEFPADSV
jgi:hypothetical protein